MSLAALASLAGGPGVAAAASAPPRFSHPVTLGRWLNNGSEIRAVDLSGDGIPDLVSADGESPDISVWQGKGNGSFRARRTYHTTAEVFDVDVSDINGDAKPDLIAAGAPQKGPITILANDGRGRFRRDLVVRSELLLAWNVAAIDVNRDGLIDLVVGGYARRDVVVLLGKPNGSFATAHRFAAVGGELGAAALDVDDLNDDGNVDIAVAGSDRLVMLLGNGDGTFRPSIRLGRYSPGRNGEPADLQLADVNRDGKLDLLLAHSVNGVALFLGNGDGTFGPQAQSVFDGPTSNLAIVDIDGDTNLDVAAGGFVLSGRGDGTFGEPQSLPTNFAEDQNVASAVADFNLDGRPDIALGPGDAFGDLFSVGVFLNWTGLPAPPCVVPPLDRGRVDGPRPRLRRAQRLLHSNGCAVGRVRSRPSPRVRKGRILDQHPEAGSVRPSRSLVDLVVSRGPRR